LAALIATPAFFVLGSTIFGFGGYNLIGNAAGVLLGLAGGMLGGAIMNSIWPGRWGSAIGGIAGGGLVFLGAQALLVPFLFFDIFTNGLQLCC
jgi:hypothetical protein